MKVTLSHRLHLYVDELDIGKIISTYPAISISEIVCLI